VFTSKIIENNEKINEIDKLKRLRSTIDSRLRTEKTEIGKIEYVNFQDRFETISSDANFVIYGRRGSGKTTLLLALEQNISPKSSTVYIDCEKCKNFTYPNTLIFLLLQIIKDIKKLKSRPLANLIFKKNKDLIELENKLKRLFGDSDVKDISIKDEMIERTVGRTGIKFAETVDIASLEKGKSNIKTKQFVHSLEKIRVLEHELTEFQEVMKKYIKNLNKKAFFILLDDFYFVNKEDQPKIIDYVHRLCKNSNLYYKLATVKHRSKLYEKSDNKIFGIKEKMDFQSIDLDYTLENFNLTEEFLSSISNDILSKANLDKESIFIKGNNGFPRLVWASGGVPRDFLNIFRYCIDAMINSNNFSKIDKKQINSSSQKYFSDKLSELDTKDYSKGKVQNLFQKIHDFCIELHKRTAFLIRQTNVSKTEIQEHFNDLIDLRFIHLAKKGVTVKKRQGEIFNAYILDIGNYALELPLQSKKIQEINILREFKAKHDSEFRINTPILEWAELEKVEEKITEKRKEQEKKSKKQKVKPSEQLAQTKLDLNL